MAWHPEDILGGNLHGVDSSVFLAMLATIRTRSLSTASLPLFTSQRRAFRPHMEVLVSKMFLYMCIMN